MLLQFKTVLEESLVRCLAKTPWRSAPELHSQICREFAPYTLRGVYKELTKLERQGVLVKVRGKYSLRLAWVIELLSFADSLYQRYLTPAFLETAFSASSRKFSWNFSSLIRLDLTWTQLMLSLARLYPGKPICLWCPHQWFNLAHAEAIRQFFRANELIGVKRYHMIGGRTFLDSLGAKLLPKSAVISHVPGPFEDLRSTYYTVIGAHVITVKLSESATYRIECLFSEIKNEQEHLRYAYETFFSVPAKCKLTLERHPAKAERLHLQFAEYFGIKSNILLPSPSAKKKDD